MTLISNGDGTYIASPLDVVMILHNVVAGTFHAAFFEEAPLPGVPTAKSVRLRCRLHCLLGALSLEVALADLFGLASKIRVPPENVWCDKPPYPWDGRRRGITLVVANWKVRP